MDVLHDREQQQFVIKLEAGEAILAYKKASQNTVDFYRTYVPFKSRGQGYAEQLVACGLNWARESGFDITASCWYVRDHLKQ